MRRRHISPEKEQDRIGGGLIPGAAPADDADASGPDFAADPDIANWETAIQLRLEHPRWVVLWLAREGLYRAYPRFRTPAGTSVSSVQPEELTAQMEQIEQASKLGASAGRSLATMETRADRDEREEEENRK